MSKTELLAQELREEFGEYGYDGFRCYSCRVLCPRTWIGKAGSKAWFYVCPDCGQVYPGYDNEESWQYMVKKLVKEETVI